MDTIRQTKLLVNIDNIKHNILKIKEFVGESVKIMPVIKARGYGTGIGTLPDLFNDMGIDIVAVAVVDEGIAFRNRGYKGEIFILNQPFIEEIDAILSHDLITSASVPDFLIELNRSAALKGMVPKIHLEIDTGMGRTGVSPKNVKEIIELMKGLININIDGVFTHFASSDIDMEYTEEQIKKFNEAVLEVSKEFNLRYIHACNTGGIINNRKAHYNMVRPGISLYGHLPSKDLNGKIDLKPATVLKTKAVYVKEIDAGESVSYGRTYIADKPVKVATVPIGYADGIIRSYKGSVVINNKLAPILGVINMDSLMVDVSNIDNVLIGTDVYIWDNKNITLEDIAEKCGTINYEILSGIAPRVVKEFI